MKKLMLITAAIVSIFMLSTISCKNDDDTPTNPIDQLPSATQTGENTFGCLVNGAPLLIKNSNNMTAIYQQRLLQLGWGGLVSIFQVLSQLIQNII